MNELQWSSDGCPNDCGYCRKMKIPCVYSEEGKHRNNTCALCQKKIASDETYSYRGFNFCEKCLDEGMIIVDQQRKVLINAQYHCAAFKNAQKLQEQYDKGILDSSLLNRIKKAGGRA